MIVNEQTKHPVPEDQVTLQNVVRRAVDALQSAAGGSPLADQYAGLVSRFCSTITGNRGSSDQVAATAFQLIRLG